MLGVCYILSSIFNIGVDEQRVRFGVDHNLKPVETTSPTIMGRRISYDAKKELRHGRKAEDG
jgi:hypothetical protein